MTRLFKVSLSVVALLLVALMVLTGCGKANEALTTAEEAKQAVVDATADLEAALKNKADAKELSDKVAALTAAIQAAETVATDGDAALKAAIETAKTTITTNVDALLKAHKVDVAGLIAGKADKETVFADIKALKDMVANIEAATLAKISLEDYVNWNTVIVAYLYEVDGIKAAMEPYKALYGDDWAEIEKAFRLAEVSLYRSFGTEEDTSMADDIFQTLRNTLAKFPNPVDALYYGENGVLAYIAADDKSAAKAQDLYKDILTVYNASNDGVGTAKELIKNYYVINEDNELESVNLLEEALGLWKTEIAEDVKTLGAIYPVYDGNTKFADDKDNIEGTRAQLDAFATAVADHGGSAVTNFETTDADLVKFKANEDRIEFLNDATNGAVVTAAAAAAKAYSGEIALTPACVNAISSWNTACNNWINDFLVEGKPAVLEGENAERYAEVEALIKETKTALDAKKAELVTVATPYISDAKPFVDAIAGFYTNNALDTAKVNLFHGQALNDAWALASAWAEKYEPTGLRLELGFLGDDFTKKPFDSLNDILTLLEQYNNNITEALDDWNDLAAQRAEIAKYIDETAVLTIYDTNVKAVIGWYEKAEGDAYGLVVDGKYQTGCTLEGLKDATEAYYNTVKALEEKLDELLTAKRDAATKLKDALNALATITLSRESEIQAAKDLYTAYTADGPSKYIDDVAHEDANRELGILITDKDTKISNAENKIDEIKDAKELMDNALAAFAQPANKPAANYPYFVGDGIVAQIAYQGLVDTLDGAVDAFVAANQNKAETYTKDAEAKLAEAALIIALDDALDAEKVVKDNSTKLNALPSYFNADITKPDFEDAEGKLDDAIKAYKATAGYDATKVADAEKTLAAAQTILDKEEIYEAYAQVCVNAENSVVGKANADQAVKELRELRDTYRTTIDNYDLTAENIEATKKTDADVYLTLVKALVAQYGATYVVAPVAT